MKKLLLVLFISLVTISGIFAQTPSVTVYNPPISVNNPAWANGEYIVSSSQPFGRPSGVYRTSNNSIYVAVPDTNIVASRCIVLYRSSNNGASWSASNARFTVSSSLFSDIGFSRKS